MKFDLVRQPLVPAFLTLVLLTVAVVCRTDTAVAVAPSPEGLAIPTVGRLLERFQAAHPLWTRTFEILLLLFAGLCTGRLTVRYNLYAVSCRLAIPLFGFAVCGVACDGVSLTTATALVLLALIDKNFSRSFRSGYEFDAVFRASLYLGLLLLLVPAALPLVALFPLAVLLFRRTLREALVALAGMLLPGSVFGYVAWAMGGDFPAAFAWIGTAFLAGEPFALLHAPVPVLAAAGVLLAMDFAAIVLLLSNRYIIGIKPRFILLYNIGILFFTLLSAAAPAATPALLPLLAVPSAVLLPVLFVRIRPPFAFALYLVLLAGIVAVMIS